MAKKPKPPEHENLERWMVSYADFVTLLFATFVVLYALSQVDIKDFKALEESIRQAFSAPSIMQGADGILNEQSQSSLMDTSQGDSMISPLMMEYVSQKYEEKSFQEIEKKIETMVKSGEIDGVEVVMTERGLLIRFNEDYLFEPASATIQASAKIKLDKIGATIARKFILHIIRVEGHTDNSPMRNAQFPSNWELSSARACSILRYLVDRFSFMPSIFSAVGFADTRPISANNSPSGKAKNRRVEILILKNKYSKGENPQNAIMKMSKEEQEKMQTRRMEIISKVDSISDAAKKLAKGNKKAEESAIILNDVYEKEIKRLSEETNAYDPEVKQKVTGQGSWLRPPAVHKIISP